LDAKGVSHSGVVDNGIGLTVVFRDPDNIQLDLLVHPSADELTGVTGVFSEADSADARRLLKG
jgi:glyoxylase I family protein